MRDENESNALFGILKRSARSPIKAYCFLSEAVRYTVQTRHATAESTGKRHVSGSELVRGTLEFALMEYGFLAPDVFKYWRFRTGRDIGNAVYAMIDAGLLSAAPEDKIEDFNGFDDLPGALHAILRETGAEPALEGSVQ